MSAPQLQTRELKRCESTQDELWALIEAEQKGAERTPDALYSLEQRAGRGRRGRAWLSPPQSCLCVSWRLPTEGLEARELWALSFVGAVAVARALRQLGAPCELKWPNDVLWRDKKLAGLLCEARVNALSALNGGQGLAPSPVVVLGLGLNLTPHPLAHERSVSLGELLSQVRAEPVACDALAPAALVELLSAELWGALSLLKTQGAEAVIMAWREDSLPRGALLKSGELEGRLIEVSAQGALLLDTAQGVVSIEAGEVELVSSS